MNNSVKKLNTAAVWVVSIVFSFIGVFVVLITSSSAVEGSVRIDSLVIATNVPAPTTTTTVDSKVPPTTYPGVNPSCNSMDPGPDCYVMLPPPVTEATPPAVTWEELGFTAYMPLSIEQITEGMTVCRVSTGNGGYMEDLVVHTVINFVPKSPGVVLPEYGSDYSTHVLVEWTSDFSGVTEAFLDLRYATDMGLTGNRQDEVRTFAGTCREPISAEFVKVVLLPESH